MAEESMTVKAYAKGIGLAPRKVSIVTTLVRNRTVADALVILSHTPRRPALAITKVIESARANATNNFGLDAKSLVITTITATTGKRLKRFKPASRGRALPFEKKTTNILVKVTGVPKKKRASTKTETKVSTSSTVKEQK